jgi:hypothetical protein
MENRIMTITVKMDDHHYCLSDGTEDGAIVPYGERATLDLPTGEIYTALIVDQDDQNPQVFSVDEVTQVASDIDEVEFPRDLIAARKTYEAIETKGAGTDATVEVLPVRESLN